MFCHVATIQVHSLTPAFPFCCTTHGCSHFAVMSELTSVVTEDRKSLPEDTSNKEFDEILRDRFTESMVIPTPHP